MNGYTLILAVAYFVPTVVALVRKVQNPWPTIIVNVFLGWSLLGWVVALVMAVSMKTKVVATNAIPRRPDGEQWPTSYQKR